jgi:ribosomal protein L24
MTLGVSLPKLPRKFQRPAPGHGEPETFWEFQNNTYCEGLLELEVASNTLNFQDVTPTQDELGLWNDCPSDAVRMSIFKLQTVRARAHIELWPNDRVKVVNGLKEDLGATGIVESVEESEVDEVLVILDTDAGGKLRRFYGTDLEKFFQIGDFVKVMNGEEQGRCGWVVRVDQQDIVFAEHGTLEEVSLLNPIIRVVSENMVSNLKVHVRIVNLNRHMQSFHTRKDQRNFDGINQDSGSHYRNMQGMPISFVRTGLKGFTGYIRSFHEHTSTTREGSAEVKLQPAHQCITSCTSCRRLLKTGHICHPRCYGCHFEKLQSIFCVQDQYILGATVEIETQSKIQTTDILNIRPSR